MSLYYVVIYYFLETAVNINTEYLENTEYSINFVYVTQNVQNSKYDESTI